MRSGIWHQMGDRSQLLVLEQIQNGAGVGVIISPRDLTIQNAVDYAAQYRDLGVDILIDQQFYIPDFKNKRLETYSLQQCRAPVSHLCKLNDATQVFIKNELAVINYELGASAVIAPAVMYEAGRRDITDLNARLFLCARTAANELGIPCYATVCLARSVTTNDQTLFATLSDATALDADGWYFGYEFPQTERIPSIFDDVLRCAVTGLTLACTGKPVLHANAGPMAILSPVFGATGAGIGHFQNTWQFTRARYQKSNGQGGGGDAPSRFFSGTLWGTIIYPDEIVGLPADIHDQVLTITPFSSQLHQAGTPPWGHWEANKHLISLLSSVVQPIFDLGDPRTASQRANEILTQAVGLHAAIRNTGIVLHDNTDAYQYNWKRVIEDLIIQRSQDFEYLEALQV